MNTVKVGDEFEKKSYDLIVKAIKNDELGISESSAKLFQKKGYYSRDREKDIFFDLSIEIWPKNADRYTLLYLIECKSSTVKRVPVDDVEEFYAKVIQVSGLNVKGVMISDNSFQEGGITFAKNKGMMLIEVDSSGEHDIILHKTEKTQNAISDIETDIDNIFESFIHKTLGLQKIIGLKKLSTDEIELIAYRVLSECKQLSKPIVFEDFMIRLSEKYLLNFSIESNLETVNGKKILGYFSNIDNTIHIDNSIVSTSRLGFVLGHELGHYFLHNELKLNQEKYNNFEDSEYNFLLDKHLLRNDKNWLEWQANRFAISLFLPKDLFLGHLFAFRKFIGISNYRHIYLDDQRINQEDYKKTVDYLASTFNISKIAVRYRIDELKIITHAESKYDLGSYKRKIFVE